MKPLLSTWPAKKRAIAFLPIVAGVFLVAFITLALATQHFFLTLLLAPLAAVGGAYALVGFPQLPTRKDGRPRLEPRAKPYLFFLLAPLFTLVLYPTLGIALTEARLPPTLLAYVSIALSIGLGFTGAYLLVGFPDLHRQSAQLYRTIPTERRPFLFFPLFVVLFLAVYLVIGVTTTRVMGRLPTDPATLLNLQVLFLLPASLLLAGGGAYLLVGFPKPNRHPRDYLPKIGGRHRPQYFLLTVLVAGIPFTVILGALLTGLAKTRVGAFVPADLILPLSVALGYVLSLGVAALSWGTPARWRRFDDYTPGLPAKMRIPVHGAISLLTWFAITIVFGLAGLDIFWGLLAGALAGTAVLLALTGLGRKIAERRRQGQLMPDLPDGLKPLVLFPTWFFIAGLLFAVLTYALPRIVALNAVIGAVVGLAVAFLLVESRLAKDLLEERRREKEKRKAWEARRKQALEEGADDAPQA